MDLRINLSQSQVQKPIITIMMSPQMQQAIQLLQLPVLELSQKIEQELAQNPVIEEVITENSDEEVDLLEQKAEKVEEKDPNIEELKFKEEFDILTKIDDEWRDYFQQSSSFYKHSEEDEEKRRYLENSITSQVSLQEHLELQMKMARAGTILMAASVAVVALLKLALIAQLVAVAFSLAGCTIFPLFLLGIWWSRANRQGAIAGLSVGVAISLIAIIYFISSKYGVILPAQDFITYWINPWYFAWIGAPLAIVVNIVVSLFTEEPPEDIQKFLAVQVHGG